MLTPKMAQRGGGEHCEAAHYFCGPLEEGLNRELRRIFVRMCVGRTKSLAHFAGSLSHQLLGGSITIRSGGPTRTSAEMFRCPGLPGFP